MLRTLYTLAGILLLPFALLRLFWRSARQPGYRRNIAQRLGRFKGPVEPNVIWIHAVSVGETRAAQPLIDGLQSSFPGVRILLTQTTATGRATAEALFGDTVTFAWLPWDLPWAQRAFLRTWRPAICILMETELWPNLLAACGDARISVVLANGRLSERSARRYARLPKLVRPMLQALALIAAQTSADAARFIALGARRTEVSGNLKFDLYVPAPLQALAAKWRAQLGSRRVVLLSSTRDGEESLLLPALLATLPEEVLLLLVPRHPQRFDEVARIVEGLGQPMVRRSTGRLPDSSVRIWLGDSMGEMFAWYALADLAIIGGSWLPLGGQNLIEACAVGCPVLTGPHTFNFTQATEDALAAGAAVRADDAAAAARETRRLLAEPATLHRMGDAARAFAQAHRGATARTMALIEPLIASALARDDQRIRTAPADRI